LDLIGLHAGHYILPPQAEELCGLVHILLFHKLVIIEGGTIANLP